MLLRRKSPRAWRLISLVAAYAMALQGLLVAVTAAGHAEDGGVFCQETTGIPGQPGPAATIDVCASLCTVVAAPAPPVVEPAGPPARPYRPWRPFRYEVAGASQPSSAWARAPPSA